LAAAGLEAQICRTVPDLCGEIARGAGAAFIAQEALSATALAAIAGAVERQEPWSDLPIVIFGGCESPRGGEAATLSLADALGNVTLIDRPIRRSTLVAMGRAALRARTRQYAARGLLEQLRDSVRQRDEFLALLGHELRNPLGAIDLSLHLVNAGRDPARHLAVARRQTRKLSRLVDDLLDVSRVTTGKIVLRPESVDLGRLATRCVDALAGTADASGVALTCACGDARVRVTGDVTRLDQVISNLVSNAIKYTPAGGRVHVTVERNGDVAALRVDDNGIGLAPADRERIFEPFVQASSSLDRSRGGMGLGLALVRKLVEMHHGTVAARSEGLGRGTTFTVHLPITSEAVSAVTPPRTSRGESRRVLVIDDNDDLREALAAALATHGHQVHAAADGPTGLTLASEIDPEFVLVDIGLPGIDGFEVARRLRERHGPGPFLVAITGYGTAEDRERSRSAGFDLHLTKPVDLDHLQSIVAGLEPPRFASHAPA
ncbi:MAG TPA: hybrid sensor histidine kinase/response regulator, partial [Anaeromyxobacteraceae bacterium]|nr:hybrid sensor histidine kinase/response regulator [Anaeromyxobacteraceae bacterium]